MDIYVAGSDIYVAGNENSVATRKAVAKYWKNGIAVSLSDGTQDASAYAIYVK